MGYLTLKELPIYFKPVRDISTMFEVRTCSVTLGLIINLEGSSTGVILT